MIYHLFFRNKFRDDLLCYWQILISKLIAAEHEQGGLLNVVLFERSLLMILYKHLLKDSPREVTEREREREGVTDLSLILQSGAFLFVPFFLIVKVILIIRQQTWVCKLHMHIKETSSLPFPNMYAYFSIDGFPSVFLWLAYYTIDINDMWGLISIVISFEKWIAVYTTIWYSINSLGTNQILLISHFKSLCMRFLYKLYKWKPIQQDSNTITDFILYQDADY